MEHVLSRRPNNQYCTTSTWSWLMLLCFMVSSSMFLSLYYYYYYTNRAGPVVAALGLLLAAVLVIVAARATMVTWITVLVLLAFSGMRRKVLARHGRQITAEVAVYLAKVVLTEKGLVAVACASLLSLLAMIHSHQLVNS